MGIALACWRARNRHAPSTCGLPAVGLLLQLAVGSPLWRASLACSLAYRVAFWRETGLVRRIRRGVRYHEVA